MSNKHFKLPLFVMLATTSFFFTACNDDENNSTAQENITTIQVHLTGAGFDQEFEWNDLDGVGGNNPVIDTIVVPAMTGDISSHVHVYDRSKTPEVDITDEIEAESLDHLLTYAISGANVNIAYDDTDSNGKPLGIKTIWTSTGASTGTLRIILYHEPSNKDNLSDPGGETDFDVTFPVSVQ